MKNLYYFIISFFMVTICGAINASDYPQTKEERRAEEIGSILGDEGIVFRPKKIRNNATRTTDSNINSYLWNATKDIIEEIAPITFSDIASGKISTEWYSNKQNPKRSFKLKIHITDDIISPESLKVELKQRILKDGRWLEEKADSYIVADIEDKILRRARHLYLRKSSK